MDAEFFHSPDIPEMNKFSIYPDKFAPEVFLVQKALSLSSDDGIMLKIGCGWDHHDSELSLKYQKIHSVDTNYKMLDDFKDLTLVIPNASCSISDSNELPFYDDYFDVAFSPRVALLDNKEIFGEVIRVLKPGGKLLATVSGENDMITLKKEFNRGKNFFDGDYLVTAEQKVQEYNIFFGNKFIVDISHYFSYVDIFRDADSLIKMLEFVDIIPDFDITHPDDYQSLQRFIRNNMSADGIVVPRHVYLWIGTNI